MSRRPARVTQADIARSLRAAMQVGGHTVAIDPDGTIRFEPANQNASSRVSEPTPMPIDDEAPFEL